MKFDLIDPTGKENGIMARPVSYELPKNLYDLKEDFINVGEILCYKTENYEFEKEYRLIGTTIEKPRISGYYYNDILIDELIVKWIPSPFMPKWFVESYLEKLMIVKGLPKRMNKSHIKINKKGNI